MTNLAQKLDAVEVAGAAPARRDAEAGTIFDLIKRSERQFAVALGKTIDPERFVRVATTTIRTNRALASCNPQSLLGALMLSAQLGLEPGGPLGHAYLVPFKNEVTFIPGYRGLIDLARRSGAVASIYAHAVYDGDAFEFELGLEQRLVHRPTATDREDAARISHVYAVAKLRDGSDPVFVVLTRAGVEKYRRRSAAGNRGPWVTDWEAMALKTAVRRLMTWLPLSVEAQAVSKTDAIAVRDVIDVELLEEDLEPLVEVPAGVDGATGELEEQRS
jgi:recombination protein RecT